MIPSGRRPKAAQCSQLLAFLGSMLLPETKATQQSHQKVWFGSVEHGYSMPLHRHVAMTLAYVAASRRSRLLAYLGSMLLSETKVTQQSHQEVWFGSAEHGFVRLQRRWSLLQLIKCFNVTRVRTRLGARPCPRHGLWVRHAGTRAQSNTHGARGLTVRRLPSGARVATWCHAVASWCHWGASWCDGVQCA